MTTSISTDISRTDEIKALAKTAAKNAAERATVDGRSDDEIFQAALLAAREVVAPATGEMDDLSARIAYRVCEELEGR